MELKILKEEDNMLQAEVVGETTTFLNLLKEVLYEDKRVKSAAFVVNHPLSGNPQIIVRTESGSPMTALKNAAEKIEKLADEFEEKFKKAK
ncbi:TPA: DNA-directed RNA polymerase subunit L [archaeon]|uniref:DNA-directed RNA polymerase subunit Rpo11 n=1 Tax=Candidatus Naiadarchaeum limnaeum TaxID=2756139 RepID=A0A832V0R4_9ARCH|nr:DNA-directed RNA polymerase subunit L [Candidatus Naiadarchaeales archaeon SRR2090153.bin1042]HIJ99980.1 DNA-directed RNA polymerase subunit L [Candidatus Naiadarchaeum limnaeum]